MDIPSVSRPFLRYLGIDLHKKYVVIGGVNAQQERVLQSRRMDLEHFATWLPEHITQDDAVVLEATTNAWDLYDQVSAYAGKTVIAHPGAVKLIAGAKVKTHKVPEVWVPPQPVRDLRALIAHRTRLVRPRTTIRNRLHSVLHRHNLLPPEGGLFAETAREWWQNLPLSPIEQLRVRQDLALLEFLEPQIATLDQELAGLSQCETWSGQCVYLMQLPGVGIVSAMTILAAIGEIQRFPSAKKLVGYAGLGASVHDSGETHRTGKITKQGRRDLRWVLVEAAWVAVNHHPYWKAQFEAL